MTNRAACLLMVLWVACGETALRDRNPVGADAGRVDVARADDTAPPTSANSMSNHAEHPVAPVSGPAPTDAAGRLAEWASVLKGAGPSIFADDIVDAAARAAVALPEAEVFGAAWNDG